MKGESAFFLFQFHNPCRAGRMSKWVIIVTLGCLWPSPRHANIFFGSPVLCHWLLRTHNSNVQDSFQNDMHGAPQILLIHTGTNNLTVRTPVQDIVLDLLVMITEALTRFSWSRILYPTLCALPDIPTSTKSKINNQILGKCSIPPYMHFLSHVNLFTKGMECSKWRQAH